MVSPCSPRSTGGDQVITPLFITPGDPLGVGAEVTAKALSAREACGRPVAAIIVGDRKAWQAQASRLSQDYPFIEPTGPLPPHLQAIEYCAHQLLSGNGRALVTGPIHKDRAAQAGFKYTGHTDFLTALCGNPRSAMAFVGGRVRVVLATIHVPLQEVAATLNASDLADLIRLSDASFREQLKLKDPKWAVCGLNPHAGDGGLLGLEEQTLIEPVVESLRGEGIHLYGPMSAETAFRQAVFGEVSGIIAMYHDQGLAPLKALEAAALIADPNNTKRSVNWTLGLPFVRTSVDHGTADSLVGTNTADANSMLCAIALAEELTS